MALRVGRGEQRWVVVEGFHCGGLALKNELVVHVEHEMPGGKEHGDVEARVHDDVLLASGEPPALEQRQHLAARLVNVYEVHSIFCWHSSWSVRVVASGHSFPSSPLGFLKEYPSDRMNRRVWRSAKRY